MNLDNYKKLVKSKLNMHNTSELLAMDTITAFNDFFIIDQTMYCNNCKYYGNHCGTFGWCTREAFPNDDGCAGYIKTGVDFCCNKWETI